MYIYIYLFKTYIYIYIYLADYTNIHARTIYWHYACRYSSNSISHWVYFHWMIQWHSKRFFWCTANFLSNIPLHIVVWDSYLKHRPTSLGTCESAEAEHFSRIAEFRWVTDYTLWININECNVQIDWQLTISELCLSIQSFLYGIAMPKENLLQVWLEGGSVFWSPTWWGCL